MEGIKIYLVPHWKFRVLCNFYGKQEKLLWSKNLSVVNKIEVPFTSLILFFEKSTLVHDLFLLQPSFVNWSLLAYKVKCKFNWNQSSIAHTNCMSYLSHEWRFFVQAPRHQFFSQCPWHLCSTSSCTHNFGERCFSYPFSFSSMLLDAQFYFFWLMLLAHILISIFLA